MTSQDPAGRASGGPAPPTPDLLEAFQQPGCAICTFTDASVRRYLESISYESVTDLGVREDLDRALGYCAVHGQQWQGVQNTLGTALIYRSVCAVVLQALDAAAGSDAGAGGLRGRLQGLLGGGSAGRELAQALTPATACPACRYAVTSEAQAVHSCVAGLGQAAFFTAYADHSVGLCLPHFRRVVAEIGDAGLLGRVVAAHAARLRATHADLSEVIRKYDYRFNREPHGAEFAAPARSVEQISGRLPLLVRPPPGG